MHWIVLAGIATGTLLYYQHYFNRQQLSFLSLLIMQKKILVFLVQSGDLNADRQAMYANNHLSLNHSELKAIHFTEESDAAFEVGYCHLVCCAQSNTSLL